jgi:hypothetical protein
MTTDPRSALTDGARWVDQASRILASLGFELIEPDRTSVDDTSHLLAALRPAPTLAHFDPETIDYWVCEAGHGKAARLDRETRFPIETEFAWGRIDITDRMGVSNQFLSFGGALRAQMTADATVIVDFSSHAPILRWSGHSQSADPLTAEAGAFFARMKVPIDFAPGAEALVAKAAPRTLYCAFIQYARERLAQTHVLRDANRWLADWSGRETARMEATAPEHWKAAVELRRELGLIEAVARE